MLQTADGYNRAVLHFTAVRDAQYLGAGICGPALTPTSHRAAIPITGVPPLSRCSPRSSSRRRQLPWSPASTVHPDRGLLAAAVVAEDPYVRAAIAVLTPA